MASGYLRRLKENDPERLKKFSSAGGKKKYEIYGPPDLTNAHIARKRNAAARRAIKATELAAAEALPARVQP